ncbi:MAG: hypothetical protein VXZ72_04930 [Chlamydiota bacterium]|nr:hypothetical protein [Chlamydiota bacterium]
MSTADKIAKAAEFLKNINLTCETPKTNEQKIKRSTTICFVIALLLTIPALTLILNHSLSATTRFWMALPSEGLAASVFSYMLINLIAKKEILTAKKDARDWRLIIIGALFTATMVGLIVAMPRIGPKLLLANRISLIGTALFTGLMIKHKLFVDESYPDAMQSLSNRIREQMQALQDTVKNELIDSRMQEVLRRMLLPGINL